MTSQPAWRPSPALEAEVTTVATGEQPRRRLPSDIDRRHRGWTELADDDLHRPPLDPQQPARTCHLPRGSGQRIVIDTLNIRDG